MPQQIKQWSYSRYGHYQQCPFRLKCKAILKLKELSSYALERGIETHAKAESFVKGQITGMPHELAKFSGEFRGVKQLYLKEEVYTELDVAVTKNWEPSAYNDWDNVWCRGNVDLCVIQGDVATDVDYKTGKQYPTHEGQGELYAINTMVHFPDVKVVDTEFWYLDSGEIVLGQYKRKDLAKLQKKWEKAVKPMMTDTEFKATPNDKCKWCAFSKKNGGPCVEA